MDVLTETLDGTEHHAKAIDNVLKALISLKGAVVIRLETRNQLRAVKYFG